jgi:WD and tetratricopeptide repeat-containing protein 1
MLSSSHNITSHIQNREGSTIYTKKSFFSHPPSFQNRVVEHEGLVKRLEKTATLDGHSGPVNSVSFDEKGNFLISGSHDCKIKLWDLNNNKRLVQSYDAGHFGAIYCTKFLPSSSNQFILSCGGDSQIRVSNTMKETVRPFHCHFSKVKCLACEEGNPNFFLSASEDGTVRYFDLRMKHHCGNRRQECNNVIVDLRRRKKRRLGSSGFRAYTSTRIELTAIAMNPRDPNQFVVGGGDPIVRYFSFAS